MCRQMAESSRAQEKTCRQETTRGVKCAVPLPAQQQTTRNCCLTFLQGRALHSDQRHRLILLAFARDRIQRSDVQSQRACRWAERRSKPARR